PRNVMLRTRPNSVTDLDGDGVPEVVFNLFSATGDSKWHLMILDIGTGKSLVDAADTFVWGIEDLDGDGRPELLCCRTTQIDPRTLGELSVCRFESGGLRPQWSLADARFLTSDVAQLLPGVATGAVDGRTTVFRADLDGDSNREFVVERDTDGD